jgi:hypothetical protein
MGTKAEELALLAQGKGCLAKAADDELIFIFRSQDKLYNLPVQVWADELASIHGKDHPKVVEAYQNLERAKAWQETHTTKYPD